MRNSESEELIFNNMPSEEELIRLLHTHHEENDPRSSFYIRTHVIPEIDWLKSLLNVTLALFAGLIISMICFYLLNPFIPVYALLSAQIVFIASMLFIVLRRVRVILKWSIRIYQRFAPIEVRNKCRFEPSCSVYMIQAIEKYGAIKGLSLGIQRLRKCNINGGGYDYP
ncbi:membrane protein insertion efficiency factor YidD [Paenibacillus amylolyticus]|uniref:membrane protein insertion efficiency factor YidD n=1 Tax=Paenibacillus amylolyticus TaxID=1451 RepID=UPI0039B08076